MSLSRLASDEILTLDNFINLEDFEDYFYFQNKRILNEHG